uniref:Uncharacterized protein n=1 Tax=Lotharella oceanica TaxID=641309 RepID=A0A7S2TN07_9EUKA
MNTNQHSLIKVTIWKRRPPPTLIVHSIPKGIKIVTRLDEHESGGSLRVEVSFWIFDNNRACHCCRKSFKQHLQLLSKVTTDDFCHASFGS